MESRKFRCREKGTEEKENGTKKKKGGKENEANQHFRDYLEFRILVARISSVVKLPQGQEEAG